MSTIELTDIIHKFTKEQRATAFREWRGIEAEMEHQMLWELEMHGVSVADPKSIAYTDPWEIRDRLIEAGEEYLNEVFTSDLLTEFLVYSQWDGLMDTPYDNLAEDAEDTEERDEWNARGVLWSLSLWEVVDGVLREYVIALEDLSNAAADEYEAEWHLN
nr:MAG TPA: hypothetical protein [Caudoviricetes sp.]